MMTLTARGLASILLLIATRSPPATMGTTAHLRGALVTNTRMTTQAVVLLEGVQGCTMTTQLLLLPVAQIHLINPKEVATPRQLLLATTEALRTAVCLEPVDPTLPHPPPMSPGATAVVMGEVGKLRAAMIMDGRDQEL